MAARILNIAGSDGNEIPYASFIDWAFNSAKALEHRKDRLRNVKLFQPGSPELWQGDGKKTSK